MLSRAELKGTIQNVAASIAATMDVDIMVLDNERNVAGGTVGRQTTYFVSQVYDYIMKEKKFLILENPGEHELCKGCKFYGKCKELIEMDAPIIVRGECVGVLSVTAYTKEHRDNVLKKKEDYSVFLMNMAQLIASKVGEVIANEKLKILALRLSSIINSVNEGMIAIDEKGIIIHSNPLAETIIERPKTELIGQKWERFFRIGAGIDAYAKKLRKQEVCLIRPDGKEIYCYISTNPIVGDIGELLGTVIVLEDVGNIKKLVGNIMGYNWKAFQFADIIGNSKAIREAKERALKASATDSTLLIRGESGTGKELFARAVHNASQRANAPFVALNCAAIPDSLLESELFGYESGAFTGANKAGKPGKFELADTGTIFLDEIGDMPIYLQVKLLRVIQEKSIQRVGGVKETEIDIRIISATNKDLEKLVAENRFREDLFYRLNVIPLQIPPLRERREDILKLMEFFLDKYCTRLGKQIRNMDEELKQILMQYRWPGNVRELENVMEYALNMETGDCLTLASLPENIRTSAKIDNGGDTLKAMLWRYEAQLIEEKIRKYGRTVEAKSKIAQELGIGVATLYRKLRDLNLE